MKTPDDWTELEMLARHRERVEAGEMDGAGRMLARLLLGFLLLLGFFFLLREAGAVIAFVAVAAAVALRRLTR